MAISAEMIKELRAQTGAGVLDCKKALDETNGDFDKAAERLRQKGLAAAAKKTDRVANEGLIGTYVHTGSKVAGMVEVNCETDFVARTDAFQALVRDLAMQVVAARPTYVSRADIPADILAAKQAEFMAEMADSGKPADILQRIVEGKADKYFQETLLLEQPFIKDPSVTINDLVTQAIAKLGENIKVRRFARLEIGENDGATA
ncbi:MAG: translation elongation factor Ts [Anaerolineae bacterium]